MKTVYWNMTINYKLQAMLTFKTKELWKVKCVVLDPHNNEFLF